MYSPDGGLLSSHVEYGPEAGWAVYNYMDGESKAQKNERTSSCFIVRKRPGVRVALRSPLDMSQLHAYRQSQSVGWEWQELIKGRLDKGESV